MYGEVSVCEKHYIMKPNLLLVVCTTAVVATTAIMASSKHTNDVKDSVEEIRTEIKQLKKDVKEIHEVVLYNNKQYVKLSEAEEECLARNIYYEAGVEDHSGKIAVAQVTLNRMESGRWGNDVCKVVYAKSQFSWTRDKRKRYNKPKGELWNASLAAVRDFKRGWRVRNLENSHFYHTDYIARPNWADPKQKVHKIGQHIFYSGAKEHK